MCDEDSSEVLGHDNWITAESRQMWRTRKNTSSQSSATIIETVQDPQLTVLFVPTVLTDSVTRIGRLQLSNLLEILIPAEIKEARVKSRKNVVTVDANTRTVVPSLLLTSVLCGMTVRSYLPRGKNAIASIIQDLDNDIPGSDLAVLVSSATTAMEGRRFETPKSVETVF